MKHKRSIQLIPDDIQGLAPEIVSELANVTFKGLRQWQKLGAKCARCEHEGWLNRYELEREHGLLPLAELQPLLRCKRCGNEERNRFIVAMMARD
jgi:hypothetical protein